MIYNDFRVTTALPSSFTVVFEANVTYQGAYGLPSSTWPMTAFLVEQDKTRTHMYSRWLIGQFVGFLEFQGEF